MIEAEEQEHLSEEKYNLLFRLSEEIDLLTYQLLHLFITSWVQKFLKSHPTSELIITSLRAEFLPIGAELNHLEA